ncbi:DUF7448 domain-containing protein [Listeria booriae]|uniref:DUF7448 domain-containing protein n=1 Tax=Listeria booriae TaxID=1552123 RepID=UPI001625C7EC|nr:hypothetical protein [Listeria booriae]MBC2164640.1 hypothetical protein [Listeria booriae]
MAQYGDFAELKAQLLYKRIIEWTEDKLVLEDGTVITIECSEQDCCAWAEGKFKDVKLDAVITEVSDPQVYEEDSSEEHTNKGTVTIYHNNNPIAIADCNANDGNNGCYYSICSLVINKVHYQVVSA